MKIKLTENQLKEYISKVISEQNPPELPDGDNKGAYVKSGEGGGTFKDLESYKLSRKQVDAENDNVRSCGQAMIDFSQIYKRVSKDGYRLVGYDSNSKFSNIPVVRKVYSNGNTVDKFIVVYGHDLDKPDALYGKTILKMGFVSNNGENTVVKKVHNWPFNINQVITDFYSMKFVMGDASKKDINDLKSLKSGQHYDYAPGKKEIYNKENPADPNRIWMNEDKKQLKEYIRKVVSENKVIINENIGNDIEEYRMTSRRLSQQLEAFEDMIRRGDIRRANEEKESVYKFIGRLENVLMSLKRRLR